MSSKKFYPFKDFQSDQIQRSSRKTFTTHYACRNAVLNLTLVTGTTNGFIFQIIGNSLIESCGVRLTCLDCEITVSCAVKGSKGWRSGESARAQIPATTPYVGWVCCWFSPLLREVFLRVLRFSPLLKNQHFQIPIRQGIRYLILLIYLYLLIFVCFLY